MASPITDVGCCAAIALHLGYMPSHTVLNDGRASRSSLLGDPALVEDLRRRYFARQLTGDLRLYTQYTRDLLTIAKAVRRG